MADPHRAPRWVKVMGLIALALVVLLVVLQLAGGGDHGPGRHQPSGAGSATSVVAGGDADRPPAAHRP